MKKYRWAHKGNSSPEGPIPLVMDKYFVPENTIKAFKNLIKVI